MRHCVAGVGLGYGALAALLAAGVQALSSPRARYLGLMLLWATPVLAIQWCAGARNDVVSNALSNGAR